MVEFALIISLFLAILFGIVEFGRAWYYSNHLGNSVRAAARYGAVFANSSVISPKYDVSSIQTQTETYANNEIIGFMTTATVGDEPGQFGLPPGFSQITAPTFGQAAWQSKAIH